MSLKELKELIPNAKVMTREELVGKVEVEPTEFIEEQEITDGSDVNWRPLNDLLKVNVLCNDDRFSEDLIIYDEEDDFLATAYVDFKTNKVICYSGTVYFLNKENNHVYFCILNKPHE